MSQSKVSVTYSSESSAASDSLICIAGIRKFQIDKQSLATTTTIQCCAAGRGREAEHKKRRARTWDLGGQRSKFSDYFVVKSS